MEYRRLGRSGLQVSPLCLGTMLFGDRTNEEDGVQIIHAALDKGMNFIDTANVYNGGRSEDIVGKALAQDGKRDRAVVTTKVSGFTSDEINSGGSSRYHIVKECEKSLKRLRTDHIDIYLLHVMDLKTPLEESLRALDDLVTQGKVLYVGCSKWAPALTVEALMLSRANGWSKFITEQPPYNILDRSIENEMVWMCKRHGMGITPWGPIAAGILAGKYPSSGEVPPESRYTKAGSRLHKNALQVVEALRPLAEAKGCTLAEFSLAWVMNQPCVTSPIIGVRTMEHLTSALKCLDVTITDEDRKAVDEIVPPGTAVSDYYDGNINDRMRRDVGIGTHMDRPSSGLGSGKKRKRPVAN